MLASLRPAEAEALLHAWRFWARPKQLAPEGAWRFWLILAGRGFGKTRTGAEWIRERVEERKANRIALVGSTGFDVRKIMIEGQSGILNIFPPQHRPAYFPARREIHFHTGAIATVFSAEEPDRLRGPEHDTFWGDEVAAWGYPDAWDQLMLTLRLGDDPRGVVTTTPRPTRVIRELLRDRQTAITRGTTYENQANLPKAWFDQILAKYRGTTIGRQELEAEVLEEMPGALWRRAMIDARRASATPTAWDRIVVGIDPATETGETGIVVAGRALDGDYYVLDDLSGIETPSGWATKAISALKRWGAARIVPEVNQGGQMVIATLRTVWADVPIKAVRAAQGKKARAEPVVALYEQGRVHHVGVFPDLEDEQCNWEPALSTESPNRLDALVWALTELSSGADDLLLAPAGVGDGSSWAV